MHRYLNIILSLLLASGLAVTSGAAFAEPALTDTPTVNINQASADEIAEVLSGVGMTRAEAIVADREQHGAYQSADELVRVKGIGPSTVEQNRGRINVE
ncbi:hypothetical protein A167_01347 [Alcanivorax sp. S71-1-4]|uniref:ComEA family DNA-binding protein n=1 Tax=Alcanivorax sp. S71-1-4 TaxID=1177159 RepID=UPI00135CBB5B|nr:ComEA family DNA-binding protein [Alcanivorax sp. S71-1-4]KAF0809807.1 hypothetical protein A167_01347 [Alcanivorax sp. S71-1-4]